LVVIVTPAVLVKADQAGTAGSRAAEQLSPVIGQQAGDYLKVDRSPARIEEGEQPAQRWQVSRGVVITKEEVDRVSIGPRESLSKL